MRLDQIVGHAPVVDRLRRLLQRDRMPPTVVLEGNPGIGRRSVAIAAAAALLCREPEAGSACGVCPACRQVAAETHPDLVALPSDREVAEVPVALVREHIVQAAAESPLVGDRRVFVLPDVERLRGEAANALLKVLEEPARGTYFMMTTSRAGRLLKTIRSRSQIIRLADLTVDEVATILIRHGGFDAPAAEQRARSGRGSHRGLWQQSPPPAPRADLRALLQDGFDARRVARIVAALEAAADPVPAGSTAAAEQRRVLRWWLDDLIEDLRGDLRRDAADRAIIAIERSLQARLDLGRYIPPRLVVESLAMA